MTTELFDRGLAIRKEVVGDEYVARSLREADDFSMPMQELVTEFCWGSVWGREDLDRATRSLANVAMISVMGRPQELKAHVRGALRNGCTTVQIREVLLQVAVYAGMPAGLDAFRVAREAIDEAAREGVGE